MLAHFWDGFDGNSTVIAGRVAPTGQTWRQLDSSAGIVTVAGGQAQVISGHEAETTYFGVELGEPVTNIGGKLKWHASGTAGTEYAAFVFIIASNPNSLNPEPFVHCAMKRNQVSVGFWPTGFDGGPDSGQQIFPPPWPLDVEFAFSASIQGTKVSFTGPWGTLVAESAALAAFAGQVAEYEFTSNVAGGLTNLIDVPYLTEAWANQSTAPLDRGLENMRTVKFASVLDWLARRMLGDEANMTRQHAASFVDAINSNVREAWERNFWPEWTLTEQRFYRPAWAPGTYLPGAEVYYEPQDDYRRLRAWILASTSTPPSNLDVWEQCGLNGAAALDPYVSLDQDGRTPIGTPTRVTWDDPRQYPGTDDVLFGLSANGVQVQGPRLQRGTDGQLIAGPTKPTSVWITFRARPPEFTAAAYDATVLYQAGMKAYLPASGECYQSVSANGTLNLPPVDPVTGIGLINPNWQKIPFPYVLAEAVKRFAYADALDDDGQQDKASVTRALAEEMLETEWTKQEGQIGAVRQFRVAVR